LLETKNIIVCKVITFCEEDFLNYKLEFPSTSIIIEQLPIENYEEDLSLPTILVGWNNIKTLYPNQRISNNCINENLFWTYTVSESKESAYSIARDLIMKFFSHWLPNEYIPYDYVLDGKLSSFLEKQYSDINSMFVYFSGKAMYIYNPSESQKIVAVSLESMKFSGIDIKKAITALISKFKPICFSYKNIHQYITKGYELESSTLENLYWIKETDELTEKRLFDTIMDSDGVRYIPFLMYLLNDQIDLDENEQIYLKCLNRRDVITEWLSDRELFFKKSYVNERIKFQHSVDGLPYTKLEYSNKRTITGRINCCDKRFNPQMLDKKSEDRAMIASRFKGGKIVTFDFVSFEPRLAMFLTRDEKFINDNKNKDLHRESAKLIFNKQDISVIERGIGKDVNNTFLYGGGRELVKSKMANVVDAEAALKLVEEYLRPILDMRDRITNSCNELGYIVNSFGSIIRPQKAWAIFNNFMQSLAADILVDKLFKIKELLENHKTKFLFQVHDSFIFDFHPEELFLIEDIEKLLGQFNNISLNVEHCIGDSWQDCAKSGVINV
jgi:hypothetical protein